LHGKRSRKGILNCKSRRTEEGKEGLKALTVETQKGLVRQKNLVTKKARRQSARRAVGEDEGTLPGWQKWRASGKTPLKERGG